MSPNPPPRSTHPSAVAQAPMATPSSKRSPTSFQLFPAAEPFFPSSLGRSKSQRWLDSPSGSKSDLAGDVVKPLYRGVVVHGPKEKNATAVG